MYKSILVTGGNGYIGSHLVDRLKSTHGTDVKIIVVDNLVNSSLQNHSEFIFENVDITNKELLNKVFTKYNIDFVFHLAALADARESQKIPFEYFETNVGGTLNVLRCIQEFKLNKFVFASSCSVYGNADGLIDENTDTNPISVYGHTKLICEKIIQDFSKEYKIQSVILRLFNVVGAHANGHIGEKSKKVTRIITRVCNSVLQNKTFSMYGKNYKTKDGTCGRDYIHVEDVAEIFEIIMQKVLDNAPDSVIFNVGSGNLTTNLEIVNEVQKFTGKKVDIIYEDENDADPHSVHSNITKLKKYFDWKPTRSSLGNIILTSWKWFANS